MNTFDWDNWFVEIDKLEDELNHHVRLTPDEANGYIARLPKILDHNLCYTGDAQSVTGRNLHRALTLLPVIIGRPYIFSVEENYVNIQVFNGAQKLAFSVDEGHSCHFKLSVHDPKSNIYSCCLLGDAAVTKRAVRTRLIKRLMTMLED